MRWQMLWSAFIWHNLPPHMPLQALHVSETTL